MNLKDSNFYKILSDSDKILVSIISDWIKLCENNYLVKFSHFLDERQCELLYRFFIFLKFKNYLFYGGYDGSTRNVLAVYSDQYVIKEDEFPILPITFSYRKKDVLKHRDFLGAFMSLQIKRDMIGDILVNEGYCTTIIYNTISQYLVNNIIKIGSVGVKISSDVQIDFTPIQKYIEIKGNVTSLRLDNIISFVTNLSREKSALIIKKSDVSVNYINIANPSFPLKQGDIFSIRGYGKYFFSTITGISKKQRLHILINKYI